MMNGKGASALATEIAEHLSTGTWTVRSYKIEEAGINPFKATLVRESDGAGIHVTLGFYLCEGRVSFVPIWPTFDDGAECVPTASCVICCMAARGALLLAREIERRLLPKYEPRYAKALAIVNAGRN